MQVSVRELKNHLSEYLRLVKTKGSITITSHHAPLAKIVAIPTSTSSKQQLLTQIEGVKWNGKKAHGNRNAPEIKGDLASQYVLEDRR